MRGIVSNCFWFSILECSQPIEAHGGGRTLLKDDLLTLSKIRNWSWKVVNYIHFTYKLLKKYIREKLRKLKKKLELRNLFCIYEKKNLYLKMRSHDELIIWHWSTAKLLHQILQLVPIASFLLSWESLFVYTYLRIPTIYVTLAQHWPI